MIDGLEVQALYTDAKRKRERHIVGLALDAIEQGAGSAAWQRCERILERDGRIPRSGPRKATEETRT